MGKTLAEGGRDEAAAAGGGKGTQAAAPSRSAGASKHASQRGGSKGPRADVRMECDVDGHTASKTPCAATPHITEQEAARPGPPGPPPSTGGAAAREQQPRFAGGQADGLEFSFQP